MVCEYYDECSDEVSSTILAFQEFCALNMFGTTPHKRFALDPIQNFNAANDTASSHAALKYELNDKLLFDQSRVLERLHITRIPSGITSACQVACGGNIDLQYAVKKLDTTIKTNATAEPSEPSTPETKAGEKAMYGLLVSVTF